MSARVCPRRGRGRRSLCRARRAGPRLVSRRTKAARPRRRAQSPELATEGAQAESAGTTATGRSTFCLYGISISMPSISRWGCSRETAVAHREPGPLGDCVFSADHPRRALPIFQEGDQPRCHRAIARVAIHRRQARAARSRRALHLRDHFCSASQAWVGFWVTRVRW
jgi:hypothetical protein